MKIVKGKVVDGRVLLSDDVRLPEGNAVTVLIAEEDESFTLPDDQVEELQASIAEAARGEVVDGWELLAELQS